MVLNGHSLNWSYIKVAVSQGSVLGRLLFFVYLNDLPYGLTTNAKLFADDTSLNSVIHDSATSSISLNNDLLKTSRLDDHWKMIFDAKIRRKRLFYLVKQAQLFTKQYILTM